jgi:hypothetical protein
MLVQLAVCLALARLHLVVLVSLVLGNFNFLPVLAPCQPLALQLLQKI